MPQALHIIAACSDRKRFEPLPHHRLGSHSHGPGRVDSWLSALADGSGRAVPVRELYVGNHWAAIRGLPGIALEAGWTSVRLWAASAGYGLVGADDRVVPYSATFSSGHPDSVVAAGEGRYQSLLQYWWSAVSRGRKTE